MTGCLDDVFRVEGAGGGYSVLGPLESDGPDTFSRIPFREFN